MILDEVNEGVGGSACLAAWSIPAEMPVPAFRSMASDDCKVEAFRDRQGGCVLQEDMGEFMPKASALTYQ